MNSKPAPRLARISLALAASLSVALASLVATPAEAIVISASYRCHTDLAVSSRRYIERVLRARMRCMDAIIDNAIPPGTNCSTGDSDPKLNKQLRKAQDKLSNSGGACGGVNLQTLGYPNSCTDPTPGTPFDTIDFQTCVVNKTNQIVPFLLDYYYPPLDDFVRGSRSTCLKGAARDAATSFRGMLRARERCLLDQEVGRVDDDVRCRFDILSFGPGTGDATVDIEISHAYDRLLGAIPAACVDVQINDLDYQSSCPDRTGGIFTIFDLKNCLFDVDRNQTLTGLAINFPIDPVCGDGILSQGEQCDNGSANSNTTPDACRTNCTNPRCGDTVTDPGRGETCDDGNTVNADCCTNCVADVCGDGIKNCNEECDSATTMDKPDTCRTTCKNPSCGDGITDPGRNEECDPPDGGVTCDQFCFSTAVCGDGVKEGNEECDNGAANSDTVPDACRKTPPNDCKNAFCGDGVTDPSRNEECDDGNTADGDTCQANCTLPPVCGDGVIEGTEECDDGNANSDTAPDACRTNCKNPRCGDNVTDPGRSEQCDNGNANSNTTPDACRANCTNPRCGDAVTDPGNGENCDDANTVAGDCCTACVVDICGDGVKNCNDQCDGDNSECPAGEGCLANCTCDPACPSLGELVLFAGVGEECTVNADCEVGTCDLSLGHCRTVTRLDSGWTGAAHNADINNHVVTRGFLDCPGHGPACGQCNVAGLDPSTNSCRCANNNRGVCDDKFSANSSDCKACVNAARRNGLTCVSNTDCLDTQTCTRNVKVCTNNNNAICTKNTDCVSPGTCPATATRTTCNATGSTTFCTTNAECLFQGACTGTAACNCFLGAPFPLSSAGTPACILNRFSEDVFGTANVDLGAGQLTARLKTVVYLGPDTKNPCPTCGGKCSNDSSVFCNRTADCIGGTCNLDPVHDDDLRGGFCTDGANIGLACDVSAVNTTFPAFVDPPSGGGYSLDCLPNTGQNISGAGLLINLTQSTGTSTLNALMPCGEGTEDLCPCLQCSGDTSIPCNTNAECVGQQGSCSQAAAARCSNNTDCASANVGPCSGGHCLLSFATLCVTNTDCQNQAVGICIASACTSFGGGTQPVPNQCDNGACTTLSDGTGECTTGPDVNYCEGILRANGNGILSCSTNDDCAEGAVGVPAEPCGLPTRQLCFPASIVATGDPDPGQPVGAATFCIPPTGNDGINLAAGLPGPGRVINQTKSRTFCEANTSQQYVPGVGGCQPTQVP